MQWDYEYDAANRLTRATSETDAVVFEYDALDNLAAMVENGNRTEFLTDPLSEWAPVLAEYEAGTLRANYFHGHALVARQPASGARQHYLFDLDGNTLALLEDGGTEINTYRWGLFGETTARVETVPQPFSFAGSFGAKQTPGGLYQTGVRFLNPALGRFLSPDPSLLPFSNLFTYADNNPVGWVDYTVHFENVATASLPAQEVVVTDPLSDRLDETTLELVELGFNGETIAFPAGRRSVITLGRVPSDPNPVFVQVEFKPETRTLVATMKSVDPTTGRLPADPASGFLPPNDARGRGEGWLRFRVRAKPTLLNGDVIENRAEIVFDVNDPIVTDPVRNVIDTAAPSSRVTGLASPAEPAFVVEWAGDDALGAGVRSYDIYVSTDGSSYRLWLDDVPETSGTYHGELGRTYSFYSLATDGLGFEETKTPTAELTVMPQPPDLTYEVWLTQHFSAEELGNPAFETTHWGVNADPDLDGILNLWEFFIGGDPRRDDPGVVIVPEISGMTASIRIRKQAGAVGVTVVAELSEDLSAWSPLTLSFLDGEHEAQTWTRASFELPASGRAFLRVSLVAAHARRVFREAGDLHE